MVRGHGSLVWEYGYSLFIDALIHAGQEDLERISGAALAVGFGRLAQNDAWEKPTGDISNYRDKSQVRKNGEELVKRMGLSPAKRKND